MRILASAKRRLGVRPRVGGGPPQRCLQQWSFFRFVSFARSLARDCMSAYVRACMHPRQLPAHRWVSLSSLFPARIIRRRAVASKLNQGGGGPVCLSACLLLTWVEQSREGYCSAGSPVLSVVCLSCSAHPKRQKRPCPGQEASPSSQHPIQSALARCACEGCLPAWGTLTKSCDTRPDMNRPDQTVNHSFNHAFGQEAWHGVVRLFYLSVSSSTGRKQARIVATRAVGEAAVICLADL